MNPEIFNHIVDVSKEIVGMLVNKRYKDLERVSQGVRLSAQDFEFAVNQYGGTICAIPENQWVNLDVVPIEVNGGKHFSVRVDLWTEEEGRSDLSLEVSLMMESNLFKIEIDDLHVL